MTAIDNIAEGVAKVFGDEARRQVDSILPPRSQDTSRPPAAAPLPTPQQAPAPDVRAEASGGLSRRTWMLIGAGSLVLVVVVALFARKRKG